MPQDYYEKKASALIKARSEPFPKVALARQLIAEKIDEITAAYLTLAAEARAAGDFEVAERILWNLLRHAPRTTYVDGAGVIDTDAAKPKEIEKGPTGPQIQIGIALGGVKQLAPVEVIDVKPEPDE